MSSLLNLDACKFFAPKEHHHLLGSFEKALHAWMAQSKRVAAYIDQPAGLFKIQDVFPIIHLIALQKDKKWHLFPAPDTTYQRREGHRFVQNVEGQEERMQPVLRLEVVRDANLAAAFNAEVTDEITQNWGKAEVPASIFSIPLWMVLKSCAGKLPFPRFTLYQHIFGNGHEYPDDGLFYIGITSRDWKTRWAEHRAAIARGSNLKFHREYASRVLSKNITYIHHKVMAVLPSLDQLMEMEEVFVQGHWDDARLLNMIPGGKAGIAYLHKHAMMQSGQRVHAEMSENALVQWLKQNPRIHMPAPWVTELWKTDEYALKVICGPEGRLSVEQVQKIRELAIQGMSAPAIREMVGAKSDRQVKGVISGRFYNRVPSPEV